LSPIAKIFRVALGIILLIIGLLGGLIPIFKGWIFGLPGLMLLGSVFPFIKRMTSSIVNKAKKKTKP